MTTFTDMARRGKADALIGTFWASNDKRDKALRLRQRRKMVDVVLDQWVELKTEDSSTGLRTCVRMKSDGSPRGYRRVS